MADTAQGMAGGELSGRRRALILAICCMSLLIVGLDSTIVNVALPSIQRDLHAQVSGLQWTVDAYTLVLASFLMLSGSTADRVGRRRTFQTGLAVFTLGSLLCALAPSLPVLILARFLQGLGGAGIMSVNGALVRFIFPRAQLGRGVGYNVLVVAASSAAGPSVAAAIMALGSWPWLFAVQVPFGVLSWFLSLRYLPYRTLPPRPLRQY